jgi:hypothetical protein
VVADAPPFARRKAIVAPPPDGFGAWRAKYYGELRGQYRVFNAAEYRFYRDNTAPPEEDDSPFDTNATLPHTPTATFADGTWWVSMSRFNGVIDSGFLPLGVNGETYVRMDIATGGAAAVYTPPRGPLSWHLEDRYNGVVRINAVYFETGSLRADTWAIAYTTDGSTPPANTPDITQAIAAGSSVVLAYDLPAQSHGTTVKVRLQTRRTNAGTDTYSENSQVKTTTADATGPAVPKGSEVWPGRLPEGV